MTDNSKDKLKQSTMGNYFTRQSKAKENKDKEEDSTSNKMNRRNRFNNTTTGDWTSGWSSGWSSWSSTDWKKKDTEDYRNEYPGKKDNLRQDDNLRFYKNEMKSYPDGDFIDNIHKKWWGQYKLLERHHGYIQWLFPIRESGMNFHAQELQLHEAKKIKEDPKAHRRVLKSYELMLDFYGMKIKDEATGELEKTQNWKERFNNLNKSYHNYLRITRILKCLGELGYEHMKVKFLEFIIEEALEKKTLKNCYKSCKDYWVETLRNDDERKYIKEYMQKVEDGYESDPSEGNWVGYSMSDEVDMQDDSQEMKYHKEQQEVEYTQADDTVPQLTNETEEVPTLTNQMSVDELEKGTDDMNCSMDEENTENTFSSDSKRMSQEDLSDSKNMTKEDKSSDFAVTESDTQKDNSESTLTDNIGNKLVTGDSQQTKGINLNNV